MHGNQYHLPRPARLYAAACAVDAEIRAARKQQDERHIRLNQPHAAPVLLGNGRAAVHADAAFERLKAVAAAHITVCRVLLQKSGEMLAADAVCVRIHKSPFLPFVGYS